MVLSMPWGGFARYPTLEVFQRSILWLVFALVFLLAFGILSYNQAS